MAAKLSQTQILEKLGVKVTPLLKLQLEGNGRLQQYYNQLAALHHLPEPFNPSFASSLIQDLLPLVAVGGAAIAPTVDVAAGGTDASLAGTTAESVDTAVAGAGVFGQLVLGIEDAVGSAWTWMVDGVSWLAGGIESFASTVLNGFTNLLENVIPGAIKTALGDAVTWGEKYVGSQLNPLKALISGGQKLLGDALHAAEHSLTGKIDGVLSKVSGVVNWFEHGAKEAVDLVLHPERLLEAIVKTISAGVVWTLAHTLLPVVVAILKDSKTLVANVLKDLESVLADVL